MEAPVGLGDLDALIDPGVSDRSSRDRGAAQELAAVSGDGQDGDRADGRAGAALFRHAKAADLPQETREEIRRHGAQIIAYAHFTPERIRRLVATLKILPAAASVSPRLWAPS